MVAAAAAAAKAVVVVMVVVVVVIWWCPTYDAKNGCRLHPCSHCQTSPWYNDSHCIPNSEMM
jgi:hypothetical protein